MSSSRQQRCVGEELVAFVQMPHVIAVASLRIAQNRVRRCEENYSLDPDVAQVCVRAVCGRGKKTMQLTGVMP